MGGGEPCNGVDEPRGHQRRRLPAWRGLGGRRRKLPVVRLGGGGGRAGGRSGGGGRRRGRGLLRRLRLRWLAARWLRRAVRRLAAIYMAALTGPPRASLSSCPSWIGVEPCFAAPFVPNARPFL